MNRMRCRSRWWGGQLGRQLFRRRAGRRSGIGTGEKERGLRKAVQAFRHSTSKSPPGKTSEAAVNQLIYNYNGVVSQHSRREKQCGAFHVEEKDSCREECKDQVQERESTEWHLLNLHSIIHGPFPFSG